MQTYKNILVALEVHSDHEEVLRKAISLAAHPSDLRSIFSLMAWPTMLIFLPIFASKANKNSSQLPLSMEYRKNSCIHLLARLQMKYIRLRSKLTLISLLWVPMEKVV